MITTIHDDFNLHKIAYSGQCFRWEQVDAQSYRIIAGARCVYVTDLGEHRFGFSCAKEEFDAFWHPYLDLDEDYAAIRGRIDPGRDPFLWKAAEAEQGVLCVSHAGGSGRPR